MIRKLSKENQENLKVLAASEPGLNVASGAHAFGRFVYSHHNTARHNTLGQSKAMCALSIMEHP